MVVIRQRSRSLTVSLGRPLRVTGRETSRVTGRALRVTGRALRVTGRALRVTGRGLRVTGRECKVGARVQILATGGEVR